MKQRGTLLMTCTVIVGGLALACSGGERLAGLQKDPGELLWSLTMNEKAITLSTDQSKPEYYTFNLIATPRTLDGTPIAGLAAPKFTTSDTNFVKVDANGVITAKKVTPTTTPVRIIATLSSLTDQVTVADTARVAVTATARPPATFTIRPDRTSFGIGYDTTLAAHVTDAAGQPVTGLRINYFATTPQILAIDTTGVISPRNLGKGSVVASAMSYGVSLRDSVEFTVTDPVVFQVDVRQDHTPPYPGYFDPAEITIKAGQGVAWNDAPTEFVSVNVTFDNPANIGPSPVDGARGNIPAFFQGKFIRMFPVPGTYTYRNTIGGTGGKVIVTP